MPASANRALYRFFQVKETVGAFILNRNPFSASNLLPCPGAVASLHEKGAIVDSQGSTPLFETERICLREFNTADAPYLYALNSNPEVLRYTGDEPFMTSKSAEAFIRDYNHYQLHGFGRWAVTLKPHHRFIGFSGLRSDPETGEVDLGFRFFAEYWSQGFATEAGSAALSLGFEKFGLEEIVGRSMRENRASIAVLQKLGMEFSEVREESGVLWLIYAMSRDNWRNITSTADPRGQ